MARAFIRVSPNTVSGLAFLMAVLAGIAVWLGGGTFLLLGALFVFLNATFDALDGKVAKLSGRASVRGDFLDHVLDRYADLFLLGGVAFSTYVPLWLGLLAILGVLMTSYMGTQVQAVGLGREYGGVLGRADRLVLLDVFLVAQALVDPTGSWLLGVAPLALTFLGWLMAVFAVLGHATAVQRAWRAWRRF